MQQFSEATPCKCNSFWVWYLVNVTILKNIQLILKLIQIIIYLNTLDHDKNIYRLTYIVFFKCWLKKILIFSSYLVFCQQICIHFFLYLYISYISDLIRLWTENLVLFIIFCIINRQNINASQNEVIWFLHRSLQLVYTNLCTYLLYRIP